MKQLFNSVKFISIIFICYSCNLKNVEDEMKYTELTKGILVEDIDSTSTDKNKYNVDNIIFKPGSILKYNYSFVKNGLEYKSSSFRNDWDLIIYDDSMTSNMNFELIILDGNPMQKFVPDYNQTVIKYSFDNDDFNEMTGLVENQRNLWMHPPRSGVFKILELSPFPFVKFPIKIGDKYNWNLIIGDHYSDEKLITWQGNISNNQDYEVTSLQSINTPLGNLECVVIEATAKSEIGIGEAKFFYNKRYGFVKMVYTNIDKSVLTLKLVDFKN